MKLLERLTKKVASTAMPVVKESVKTEVKNAAVEALPLGISLAVIFAGFLVFKNASGGKAVSDALTPAISRMNVTTNNYFFDSAMKSDVITKLIDQ